MKSEKKVIYLTGYLDFCSSASNNHCSAPSEPFIITAFEANAKAKSNITSPDVKERGERKNVGYEYIAFLRMKIQAYM